MTEATTIKITEGDPASRPTISVPNTMNPALVWQRIESYLSHRWGSRSVEYVAEGPGHWVAPLSPTTISTTEAWQDSAWVAVTLDASPLGGFYLPGEGPYRLSGTVGEAGAPPAAVREAATRLADYFADIDGAAESPAITEGRDGDFSFTRSATWAARALQHSGAADLLRPYRRRS